MYESVLQNALRLPRQLKEELVEALKGGDLRGDGGMARRGAVQVPEVRARPCRLQGSRPTRRQEVV